MSKYGQLTNDIREIFKAASPDDFLDKLVDHMDEVSKNYEAVIMIHKDPKDAMNSFFAGYLTISLMLSATENSSVSAEKKLFYISTVIQIIEQSLLENLGGADETGKETN